MPRNTHKLWLRIENNRNDPKVFPFCATRTTKNYALRHSTTQVSSLQIVKEFNEISELHWVFVIYIAEVCFVFEWRGDRVKSVRFQSVRTSFHWLREGIYKSTKRKNVLSLINRRDRWRLQEYEFFAIIRSLRSANFSKHSVIDWQKRSCKTTRVRISCDNPKSTECKNRIVD